MSFRTLDDEQEKEFRRLSIFYWKEAIRCEQGKAYLAGCAMVGSALETLLVLMVNCHSEEAERTNQLPMKGGKARPLMDWRLGDLLRVAKAANWLPTRQELGDAQKNKRMKIGDYAEFVLEIRNLIHPSRYAQDHSGRRITQRYLRQQFEIALLCRDWLADHNNRVLLENMKEEGLL